MVQAKKLPAGAKGPPSRGHRGGTGAQKAPGNSHSFCECHVPDRGSPFKGQPYFWHFGPLCSCWLWKLLITHEQTLDIGADQCASGVTKRFTAPNSSTQPDFADCGTKKKSSFVAVDSCHLCPVPPKARMSYSLLWLFQGCWVPQPGPHGQVLMAKTSTALSCRTWTLHMLLGSNPTSSFVQPCEISALWVECSPLKWYWVNCFRSYSCAVDYSQLRAVLLTWPSAYHISSSSQPHLNSDLTCLCQILHPNLPHKPHTSYCPSHQEHQISYKGRFRRANSLAACRTKTHAGGQPHKGQTHWIHEGCSQAGIFTCLSVRIRGARLFNILVTRLKRTSIIFSVKIGQGLVWQT